MPSGTIVYLLKFVPKEAYIDDLTSGHLYMTLTPTFSTLPLYPAPRSASGGKRVVIPGKVIKDNTRHAQ